MSIYVLHNKSSQEKKFYTYIFLRSTKSTIGDIGSPYYIGKGHGKRAFVKRKNAPKDKFNIKLIAENMNEADAFQLEMLLIKQYGRIDLGTGCLRNLTDGGDGVSGRLWSDEDKLKSSIRNTGSGNPMFNKKHTKQVINAQSTRMKGRLVGNKNPMYGKPCSLNRKVNISTSRTGLCVGTSNPNFGAASFTEETIKKMSDNQRGRKYVHHPITKENKRVKLDELQNYLSIGFILGSSRRLTPQQINDRTAKFKANRLANLTKS